MPDKPVPPNLESDVGTAQSARSAEQRYRELFENMVEGFLLAEVICDGAGTPVDFRYLDVNPAFEPLTGLARDQVIGKTARDVLPGIEEHWIHTFGQVALTGEPARITQFAAPLGRYYETVAYSPRRGQFACLFSDITDRKRAEDALRESEQRLLFHMENTPLAVVEWGPDFRLSRWSGEAERIFGWRAEEVLGKHIDEVHWVYEEDVQQVVDISSGLVDGTRPRSISRNRNYRKDGSVIYCEWYNSSLVDESGNLRSILSLVLDVTDRKRAEEDLRRSTTLVRAITDSTGDVIFAKDRTGRLTFANPATLELIGKPLREVLGKTDAELLADEAAAREVMDNDRRIMTMGVSEDIEEIVPLPDGTRRVWFSRKLPYRDPHGNVIGLLGISRDITERKQVEAELNRISRQRQLALDAAAMGWWHYDPITKVWRWDDRYKDIFQVTGYERPNEEVLKRLHPDDLPGVWARVEAALDPVNPQPYSAEYRINLPDGSVRWIEAHGIATFENEGDARHATSLVGTVADITERKRTEQALMSSEKLAVLGRMAATVAHEINNPLAAVMNTVYLARSEPECPDSVLQLLKMADDELKRISHITRQALGFYREASSPCEVRVGALLDEAVELFKSKARAKLVTIEKQYDTGLSVTGIPGELRQVFSNLLANSLDAVPDGGTIKVRGSRRRQPGCFDSFVRITVSDNGKGIDSASMPRIFEPLFSTKGPFGTGLGLWISRQLVEKHGGIIRVRSKTRGDRHGTTFSILLPADDTPEATSTAPPPASITAT